MDTKDLQKTKNELEELILQAIVAFKEKTSLTITSIEIIQPEKEMYLVRTIVKLQ